MRNQETLQLKKCYICTCFLIPHMWSHGCCRKKNYFPSIRGKLKTTLIHYIRFLVGRWYSFGRLKWISGYKLLLGNFFFRYIFSPNQSFPAISSNQAVKIVSLFNKPYPGRTFHINWRERRLLRVESRRCSLIVRLVADATFMMMDYKHKSIVGHELFEKLTLNRNDTVSIFFHNTTYNDIIWYRGESSYFFWDLFWVWIKIICSFLAVCVHRSCEDFFSPLEVKIWIAFRYRNFGCCERLLYTMLISTERP